MTVKEAIDELKYSRDMCYFDPSTGETGKPYSEECERMAQALDIAIEAIKALEKQIPKKVKKEFRTIGGAISCFETDICPNCEMDFYIDDLGQTMYCDFCPDCGQALDWGEDNA